MTMDSDEGIERLVRLARADARFLYRLIWYPEEALEDLGFLSQEQKVSIMAVDPHALVAGLAAGRLHENNPDGCTTTCSATCGVSSCGSTEGARGLNARVQPAEFHPLTVPLQEAQMAEAIITNLFEARLARFRG